MHTIFIAITKVGSSKITIVVNLVAALQLTACPSLRSQNRTTYRWHGVFDSTIISASSDVEACTLVQKKHKSNV